MPEVNDDKTPGPESACGRCGRPKPDDGSDWCRSCENEDAARTLAALRGWASGSSGTEDAGDDVELCPLAKVPCEENIFGMCKTCGRDLSGNPDE